MTAFKCFLCGAFAEVYKTGKTTHRVENCPKCGDYEITWPLADAIEKNREAYATVLPFLSAHTRQLTATGSDVLLTTDNYLSLAAGHRGTPVFAKLDRVLHHLARLSSRPGDKVQVGPDDHPLFDAIESAEVAFLLDTLRDQGLLKEVQVVDGR